jgi:hypothetical protein
MLAYVGLFVMAIYPMLVIAGTCNTPHYINTIRTAFVPATALTKRRNDELLADMDTLTV